MDIYSSWIVFAFVIGYVLIIFEHKIGINKATSALLMAIVLWAIQFSRPGSSEMNLEHLNMHLANVSQVILFLLGALTIVEVIHAHGGLAIIGRVLTVRSKTLSFWLVGFLSFFLSSVIDNLTTTIVMVMILRKMVHDNEERLIFGSAVVISANAGGVWTPIGDVTTTMLWVGGQVSTGPLITKLFIPSFLSFVAAMLCFTYQLKGNRKFSEASHGDSFENLQLEPRGKRIFVFGILALISVPIFKTLTGLPPFMGMLFAMSAVWFLTDILHRDRPAQQHLRVTSLLPRLDLSGILFFLGILLGINALDTAGILQHLADYIDSTVKIKELIPIIIGVVSAIIDNVPLVAACMGMYDLSVYPMDSSFWQLIAFTAGTGGSLLVIGSAAGVAFMGMEKVDFFWYLRKATVPALVGYIVGIITFLFM